MRWACLVAGLLIVPGVAGAQDVLDCHFVSGWEPTGTKRQYTPDHLYDYKDGGAEGYLVYGFTRMQGVDCKAGAATLAIDVSEMGDADLAYGMFAANRDPSLPVAKIGMGAQVLSQSLSFAKGKYFVEIVETDGNPTNNLTAVLEGFAGRMEKLLEGRTTPPAELDWFLKDDLVSARMVPESVLGLRILKHGYVAKYAQGQAFLVIEDSPASAQAVMSKMREKFEGAAPGGIADESFQLKAPYLEGMCVFRKGRYLGGYTNLVDGTAAAAQAAKLADRIPK
ncbi:MAG TPA: DUF6599 family protein [Terracidiphilus sp.]|jgi:hypothetical protein